MYKLGKWLHELGAKHERELLKADLFYYLGWQPVKRDDPETGMREAEAHYNKRLDAWFAARELIENFFKEQHDRKK